MNASARPALPRPIARFSATLAALCTSLALAGCSIGSLWPFGRDDTGRVPPPENAVQYRCNNNASFYLRTLSEGAMWVIYTDRQMRLDKDEANPKRFTNGVAVLDMESAEVSLSDGPQINYRSCAIAPKGK